MFQQTCQLTLEDKFSTISRFSVLTGGAFLRKKMSTHNGRNAAVCTYCVRLWADSSNKIEQVIQMTSIEFLNYFTGLTTHTNQEQQTTTGIIEVIIK